jgi:hypothetical protein
LAVGHGLDRCAGSSTRCFGGRDWQTLQLEIARPEADEIELVPVAVGIGDFGLDGPEEVACLSLRFQVAQKLHAVTEHTPGRENLRFWDLIDLMLLEELIGNDLTRSVKPLKRSSTLAVRTHGRRNSSSRNRGASPTPAARATSTCRPTSITPRHGSVR